MKVSEHDCDRDSEVRCFRSDGMVYPGCLDPAGATPANSGSEWTASDRASARSESLTQLRANAPDLSIVLELHEAAVTNPAEIVEFRKELNDLRIQLAYDDFGAGQARLKEL